MMRYVAGFLMAADGTVALVRKQKPAWQAGKLNGIGGKIEEGESSKQAMVREFYEETGCFVAPELWRQFAVLADGSENWRVHFFVCHVAEMLMLRTMEAEEIVVLPIDSVTIDNAIPNVTWLIPMAQTIGRGERAESFQVEEVCA
jgi:8-oxo-dGTP diphosphatase